VNPPEQRARLRDPFRPSGAAPESILNGLNEAQRRAVTHPGGPLLVLAGAGSGKTRVITHRIAHVIRAEGVSPSRIVAVTFTNKAAAEMRERVLSLMGFDGVLGWIGTFHALCLRILRRDGVRIGLAPGFNVYDSDDQLALVKRLLREESREALTGSPRAYLSRISRAKNGLESPADLERRAHIPEIQLLARLYGRYQESLRRSNAVDFDDLLVRALELFSEHPDVAEGYASRCEHLLVDEYQDTNRPQYLLVRHLASHHGNVCVVGDEDQSIYRFRGAEIRNILEFEEDHPGTRTIRLEQNYRSTGTIIEAATQLISHNRLRKGKTLWTENEPGEKLQLFRAPDDRLEAGWVAEKVAEIEHEFPYEEMAVLYRTNAQSRQMEETFRKQGIPHQVVGSVRFYERKEVKDILAYLKLTANPADDVAFRRVVNTPPRGIGETTLRLVDDLARAIGLPLMEAAARALDQDLLSRRPARMLRGFLDLMADMTARADEEPVGDLIERIIDSAGYEAYLDKLYVGQGAERMENVRALVSAAAEHAEESEEATLQSFLDRSALVSDADDVGGRPGVTLMTIHCAKGLEFSVVFMVGLEENLFPHAMSSGSDEDLEEERRLCYVAMTRARRRLLLSHAVYRRYQGTLLPNPPSRFLDEIPPRLIEETRPGESGFFETWESRPGGAAGSSAARAAARKRSRRPARLAARGGENPDDGYAIGAHVLHPRFGGGQIVDREGSGKNLKLTIDFSNHGPKKILPAYTKLSVQVG
jgi:DNA helicase-2/ATP-dependent DNA helicase PcrA